VVLVVRELARLELAFPKIRDAVKFSLLLLTESLRLSSNLKTASVIGAGNSHTRLVESI
jgi:hypothetical protein